MLISAFIKDLVAISLIVLIILPAVIYIIKAKKHGQKCIGCSYSKTCSKNLYKEYKECNCKKEN